MPLSPVAGVDGAALQAAVDERRQGADLAWAALGRDLAVSPTTLRGCGRGATLEADGALAIVRWLGRPPEDFAVGGRANAPWPFPAATWASSGRMLRCDTAALFASLDEARCDRGLSWPAVAVEVSAGGAATVAPAALRRLAGGGRTSLGLLLATTGWLDRPVADVVHLTPA